MKRSTKLILGLLSVWPIFYMVLFFLFVLGIMGMSSWMMEMDNPEGMMSGISAAFGIVIVLHFLTIFTVLGLMAFYIIHAVQNQKLESNMKIMWVVLLCAAGMIVNPIYWYLNIWNEPAGPSLPRQMSGGEPTPANDWTPRTREEDFESRGVPPDWR
jgi:hypothetical protein